MLPCSNSWKKPPLTGFSPPFVKTTLLSLVALVIVVGFLQRIDRWEPEPLTTKLAMFLWGGGGAYVRHPRARELARFPR